jgi:OOP family OmpA-OmpF porin
VFFVALPLRGFDTNSIGKGERVKTKIWGAALFATGMAMSSFGMAQGMPDTGWYVGGSFGQSEVQDFCSPGFSCDDTDTAWKIFGGYQVNRNFSIELGYTDLGEASATGTFLGSPAALNLETTAWELVGIGSVPLGRQFSIYGKVGIYRADTEVQATLGGVSDSVDETNTDLTFGLGLRYDFTRTIGVRAEWQRYSDVGGGDLGAEADIDVLSVGVVVRF